MNRSLPVLVALLLTATPFALGHAFNHGERDAECDIYTSPYGHGIGDGHAHTHDPVEAANQGLHPHDPCNQVGMAYPAFEPAEGLQVISLEEAALGTATGTPVIVGDEAYLLPVGATNIQTQINVQKDAGLRAQGFPGAGTPDNPYIIEGKVIRDFAWFKDTSECFVFRNNVVWSEAIPGPLLDPADILDLNALLPAIAEAAAAAQAERDALLAEQAERLGIEQASAADLSVIAHERNQLRSASNSLADEVTAWYDRLAASEAAIDDVATLFDSYSVAYEAPEAPRLVAGADTDARLAALADGIDALAAHLEANQPPPQEPPEWDGPAWPSYTADHVTFVDLLETRADTAGPLPADRPDEEAANAARAAFESYRDDVFKPTRNAHNALVADNDLFDQHVAARFDATQPALDDHAEILADMTTHTIEYLGDTFADLAELVQWAIALALDELNEAHTARLILDWNGQCVHAHGNLIEDLRINRNNDRVGYATGGLLEHNRIDVVGQIRHYDGQFVRNEVGDRAHLEALLDPELPQPPTERAVNHDGFNQGIFADNIVYGSIDLDLHGHHHGAGFFAPASHYHGSDESVSKMGDGAGGCKYEAEDYGYHEPPTIPERVGLPPLQESQGPCLPHFDHARRWTSVSFEDNIVIDPLGNGVRYEDLNHRGDDEQANSENMDVLKMPHFHRTAVSIADNAIVGRVLVQTFNADGTDLWSDDYSPVALNDAGKIIGALQHLDADVVNSHPGRNDGWLAIEDNLLLSGQGAAIDLLDVKEVNALDLRGNTATAIPLDGAAPHDLLGFLEWVDSARGKSASDIRMDLAAWEGTALPLTGILLRDFQSSNIAVCGNSFDGFQVGLQATQKIMEDVNLVTCPDNDWGNADPAVSFATTPLPQPGESRTQDLRDVTDETLIGNALDPVYDNVDKQGDRAIVHQTEDRLDGYV